LFDDPLRTIAIERPSPEIDDGRFPIKREVGDAVTVEVDIFKDGHEMLCAAVLYRPVGASAWSEAPLSKFDNDRWRGTFQLDAIGAWEYTFEAWVDRYGSWLDEVKKKLTAGEDVTSELLEGQHLVEAAASRVEGESRRRIERWLSDWVAKRSAVDRVGDASDGVWTEFMRAVEDRSKATRYDRTLEVVVDPVIGRLGAWYEIFPRSQGRDPDRGATFKQAALRLPEIQAMGFDVLYMPPVHPIGLTNRKGKNNARKGEPGDPGSPYAIGAKEGGHMAVEPSLGTLADFDDFVLLCEQHGLKVALDFAIQCSPDHPYLREHPEWFAKRPDGTIKYAENPPKKYEDIHHLDFDSKAWRSLWDEMARIVEFWIAHGVRIFRVDNPHTKPLPFWKWLITKIKSEHPDVLFLAEAFTRPKMMRALAKVGFSQSYTYFTWRNEKDELTEYLTELTQSEMKEYFRGNFFANTPDILPFFLQNGGRPAFKIRAVLASTLSTSYGIYNGFELCENQALPGREEYLDSEKYEIKVWDWDRPGNIKNLMTVLNRARKQHPALQEYDNLRFHTADNSDILVYSKATPKRDNAVLVVVNLNPHEVRDCLVHVNPWELGKGDDEPFVVHDLISNQRWTWQGWSNYVRLDPNQEPAHLFVIE
jgi:starch synthase (maltosyl-transferring)